VACLRQWQRSVQLGGSNHPDEAAREERHLICNVCREPFSLPPEDRAGMMASLAGMPPEEIAPGLLFVTKRTSSDSASANAGLSFMVRAFIEAKAAHFREAVYILTETRAGQGGDGSDAVLGVNLSRALEAPDMAKLEAAALDETALQAYRSRGIEVLWMNGGPVRPKAVTALTLLRHPAREGRLGQGALHELVASVAGAPAVVCGSLRAVLEAVVEDCQGPAPAAACGEQLQEGPTAVLAWAGFAQWSRTQLVGEIARGSWGWCRAAASDVSAAVAARRGAACAVPLWEALRPSDRLRWAPENELSREFQGRFSRDAAPAPPEAAPAADPHAQAVDSLVRQFEALRRGS